MRPSASGLKRPGREEGFHLWSNIDTKRGEIRLVTRKRDKTILIPIAGPLQNHILSLPTSDDPKSPIYPIARKPSDDLAPGTKNSILKQAGFPILTKIGSSRRHAMAHNGSLQVQNLRKMGL